MQLCTSLFCVFLKVTLAVDITFRRSSATTSTMRSAIVILLFLCAIEGIPTKTAIRWQHTKMTGKERRTYWCYYWRRNSSWIDCIAVNTLCMLLFSAQYLHLFLLLLLRVFDPVRRPWERCLSPIFDSPLYQQIRPWQRALWSSYSCCTSCHETCVEGSHFFLGQSFA